jgi:hypothetical protein
VPLPRYGVAIGTPQAFTRDPQHSFGRDHIALDTPGGTWQSALDVNAPQAVGVAYQLVDDLRASDLGRVASLAPSRVRAPTHTSPRRDRKRRGLELLRRGNRQVVSERDVVV